MKKLLPIIFFTACAACAQKKAKLENHNSFHAAEKLALLNHKKLSEISGMAASVRNKGLLWVHNDSGNDPEVYLVDKDLNILLTCKLAGVKNRDWEDIAAGPGPEPGKTYLYVAEIGDNEARYPYKHIYRFEEPLRPQAEKEITVTHIETITFQLPHHTKDTETLLLDAGTKDLYIISKREQPVYVYRLPFPQSTTDTLTAETLATLPMTQIVGGDLSVDGKELLLKNYEHIYYWKRKAGETFADMVKRTPYEIEYEPEPQGESIAFAIDGGGFFTLSEQNAQQETYLYYYKRR
jgi:hypothetical protein